jgi:hypothetical protein
MQSQYIYIYIYIYIFSLLLIVINDKQHFKINSDMHNINTRPPLWSSGQSSWLQNGDVLCFL